VPDHRPRTLRHGAYEWCWGGNPSATGKQVDQTVSKELKASVRRLPGLPRSCAANGFGSSPRATSTSTWSRPTWSRRPPRYLAALSDADRATYLAANTFITWSGGKATFTWADFLTHVGARKKNAPSFDGFDLSTGENNLFGTGTTKARHFTLYSLRRTTPRQQQARLDADIPAKLDLMNPMYHLVEEVNPNRSKHWWIRLGTKDTDTSLSVAGNLSARLTSLGDDVDTAYYWDAGHGADRTRATSSRGSRRWRARSEVSDQGRDVGLEVLWVPGALEVPHRLDVDLHRGAPDP
jgi:hypothetical protein